MMNFKEFQNYIKDNIKEYLPGSYENADISFNEQIRNNDIHLTGITIRRGNEMTAPNIYLNDFFEAYQNGKDLDEIVGDLADKRIEMEIPFSGKDLMGKLSDYEKAKKNLEIRLCDKEENIGKLKQQVHTEHGDFAATYHIVMGELEGGKASVAVTPWLMKKWGIAVDQLHQAALQSDREKGATFMDMDFMVMNFMGFAPEPSNLLDTPDGTMEYEGDGPGMYCLRHGEEMEGASLILQDDIMQKIGELMGGNYYILPSSIHEVLVIPENAGLTTRELSDMVHEINQTEVMEVDRLSDKVQFYDREAAVIENAEKRDARLAAQKQEVTTGKKSIHSRLGEKKQKTSERKSDGKSVNKEQVTL